MSGSICIGPIEVPRARVRFVESAGRGPYSVAREGPLPKLKQKRGGLEIRIDVIGRRIRMLEHIIQGMEPANLVKLMVYENRGSWATLYVIITPGSSARARRQPEK